MRQKLDRDALCMISVRYLQRSIFRQVPDEATPASAAVFPPMECPSSDAEEMLCCIINSTTSSAIIDNRTDRCAANVHGSAHRVQMYGSARQIFEQTNASYPTSRAVHEE